ncbi:APA family basic amino acid/polyamine antiporter [Rhizomicrobium palustre]|uniref:APA family basic amino acid/polyamine antiporter n=1 Tax=Rhizomicrobium palustre TaxID=189966 RepID=A0A846N1K5_9PROT|nr:amino acid permease [Rhizomicrobium palustre]NIK89483.1 APA family basic amino acid/polyamine antiporter [Rhizomicrobium palustre]
MAFWSRCKSIDSHLSHASGRHLKATLRWWHLLMMGVGAIVGTGIYTLTGIGAGLAGPGVLLSFVVCGVISTCAALCYAEMATAIPASGSAYTYTYTVLGEALAWIVGWSLILEYTVSAAAVAVGWSGYFSEFIHTAGIAVPEVLLHGTFAGGWIDIPAVILSAIVTLLLILGTRESALITTVLVLVKLAALLLFVVIAFQGFNLANFHPFLPSGIGAHVDGDGVKRGVLAASALIFFAFYGFDAVSTAAEETKDPQRDLKIGIIGSMALSSSIYMLVALAALGACYYTDLSKAAAPLAHVLNMLNNPLAAQIVSMAAIIALPSVILVVMYGQSRVFYVMARDGLLPRSLAKVSENRGTPVFITAVTGVIVALLSATLRLDNIALLANAGTLFAFIAVAASVLMLRWRAPEHKRTFKVPAPWLVAPLCIVGCSYLFVNGLPATTQIWFLIWNGIGLVLYFAYGARRSALAAPQAAE